VLRSLLEEFIFL